MPALVSDQYSSVSRCSRALSVRVFLQGNHDRLDLACPEDHLMVGDLGIERLRTLTHANEGNPRANVAPDPD